MGKSKILVEVFGGLGVAFWIVFTLGIVFAAAFLCGSCLLDPYC